MTSIEKIQNLENKINENMTIAQDAGFSDDKYLTQRKNEYWNRTLLALQYCFGGPGGSRFCLAKHQPENYDKISFQSVSFKSILPAVQLAADEQDLENKNAPFACSVLKSSDANAKNLQILVFVTYTNSGVREIWYDAVNVWHAMYPKTSLKHKRRCLMGYNQVTCQMPELLNGQFESLKFVELWDARLGALRYRPVMKALDIYNFLHSNFVQSRLHSAFKQISITANNYEIEANSDEDECETRHCGVRVKRKLEQGKDLMAIAADSELFGFVAQNYMFLTAYNSYCRAKLM
jgi:hypothetical protein